MPDLAAKVGAGAFLVVIALRVLSVNVFAVITNDSVGYLGWATSPMSQGWIAQGYRQAAYPISLWIFEKLDGMLELDRIFTIALGQRLLLVLGLALAWWALRWWSTVALLIISSSTIVVLTNFILRSTPRGPDRHIYHQLGTSPPRLHTTRRVPALRLARILRARVSFPAPGRLQPRQ